MKGKHDFVVSNRFIKYEFTIRRNITLIQGDSATGKTALLSMLNAYSIDSESSGIQVISDVPFFVYHFAGATEWKTILQANEGRIVFIDEDFDFISTTEFAEYVGHSNSYYVIVTREDLENLPYSVEEIYRIKESGKYGTTSQTYNVFESIYLDDKQKLSVRDESHGISCVITEDSKAGFQFWKTLCDKSQKKCVSAFGKSNVIKCMREYEQENLLLIVDGAAFGSQMRRMNRALNGFSENQCVLFLPESFEWILLKADLLQNIPKLQDILTNTYDYVDSKEFMSWERFFTSLVVRESEGKPYQYNKNHLNEYFVGSKSINKIETEFPIISKI